MDVAELRALAHQTYAYVEPAGQHVAVEWAAELEAKGIVAGAHTAERLDSFDEKTELEHALGKFVHLVKSHSWFAMNSQLNKIHELAGEPEDAG